MSLVAGVSEITGSTVRVSSTIYTIYDIEEKSVDFYLDNIVIATISSPTYSEETSAASLYKYQFSYVYSGLSSDTSYKFSIVVYRTLFRSQPRSSWYRYPMENYTAFTLDVPYYFPAKSIQLSIIGKIAKNVNEINGPPYSLGNMRGQYIYDKADNDILLTPNQPISMSQFINNTFTVPTYIVNVPDRNDNVHHDDSYVTAGGTILEVRWPATWWFDCYVGWTGFSYKTNGTKIYSLTIIPVDGCTTGGTNTGGRIDYASASITTTGKTPETRNLDISYPFKSQTLIFRGGCLSISVSLKADGKSALASGSPRINQTFFP